ncbi:MAG: lysophospholipid acyltransferase family protein [Nitrospirae bacterium]|nr:lysophospholipid acyltransferase family protein [Nitrospirota bacterium]
MKTDKTGSKKRSELRWLAEYAAVRVLFFVADLLPSKVIKALSALLGRLLYELVPKRRRIALENLRYAFAGKSEGELKALALESFRAFFLNFLEVIKQRRVLLAGDAAEKLERNTAGVSALFEKAREIHDKSGGCIFVTPHLGNWELLPYVSSIAGIQMVVVVRPMDNPYLERLIYAKRSQSGQLFIAKKNSLFALQKTLMQGKSVGLLPDQSTAKGVYVNYFGRPATATPVPAMLSTLYKRPIVVVACCRTKDANRFTGYVSDPIYPGEYKSEKAEILRLTRELTGEMERVVAMFPGQYLWMHNRWKRYGKENLWAKDAGQTTGPDKVDKDKVKEGDVKAGEVNKDEVKVSDVKADELKEDRR